MRCWLSYLLLVSITVAGCQNAPRTVGLRVTEPTAPRTSRELPAVKPTPLVPLVLGEPGAGGDCSSTPLPGWAPSYRELTEGDCQLLAAINAAQANLIDEENRLPPAVSPPPNRPALRRCGKLPVDGSRAADDVRVFVRQNLALELRNRSIAEALERYFLLVEAGCRIELLSESCAVVEDLLARARAAKEADVRVPVEVADLELQLSSLLTQREQARSTSRLLSLDLKRRLGLPSRPTDEALWPRGDFRITETGPDAEWLVEQALADRPELRAWRAMYYGLGPGLLPEVRDLLRSFSPLLGARSDSEVRPGLVPGLVSRLGSPGGPGAVPFAEEHDCRLSGELEIRRKQLYDLIVERERRVADETRAAVIVRDSQRVRVEQARDRVGVWEKRLAEARKKRAAGQPGAEWTEPYVRLEWLRARGELASEVVAWHRSRVGLKLATGALVWEVVADR